MYQVASAIERRSCTSSIGEFGSSFSISSSSFLMFGSAASAIAPAFGTPTLGRTTYSSSIAESRAGERQGRKSYDALRAVAHRGSRRRAHAAKLPCLLITARDVVGDSRGIAGGSQQPAWITATRASRRCGPLRAAVLHSLPRLRRAFLYDALRAVTRCVASSSVRPDALARGDGGARLRCAMGPRRDRSGRTAASPHGAS